MGWTVYIKDNSDGLDLLKIITQESNNTFTGIVESYEKAGFLTKDSYMKKGKKTIRGNQKILRALMQEARPTRKQMQRSTKPIQNDDYNNIMHDIIFSGEQDDDDNEQDIKIKQKEEIDEKVNRMQNVRDKSRPPAKVPKEEKMESIYSNDDMKAEDDMNDYLNNLINKHGDD